MYPAIGSDVPGHLINAIGGQPEISQISADIQDGCLEDCCWQIYDLNGFGVVVVVYSLAHLDVNKTMYLEWETGVR